MSSLNIDNGRYDTTISIDKVEATYNSKFVGILCLKHPGGEWGQEAPVFYITNPRIKKRKRKNTPIYVSTTLTPL